MNDIPAETTLQPADAALTTAHDGPLWVVGIGAGAGGLEAIQLLFGAMPIDPRLAFVICRHVQSGLSDPLADLLCTQTSLPVVQAEDGVRIEGGRIHLVAPDARMILVKDRLVRFVPEDEDETEAEVSPIDILLHSLAVSAGPAAIAVMLSGLDDDGLSGCASVRGHGGLVLAQHPDSTEFAAMPRQVIEAELASAAAPPGALPELIRRHIGRSLTSDAGQDPGAGDEAALARITALLESRFGIDARAYRPSLVAKRVRRRLTIARAATLADYAEILSSNAEELAALRDDLLIRVTAFFRDPEAYAVLQRDVLPALVERMSKDAPLRIWVPACATGEEPYSLAMLLLEHIERAGKDAHVEIIGSDRHAAALELGRSGRYGRTSLGPIPKGLAERYLLTRGEQIEVGPSLRRHVTFIEHDILSATPPDDIDLVSCRNLMIYLAAPARERVLAACNQALKPGGFLFLGPSEQPGSRITDLDIVNSKWRIYKKPEEPPVDRALKRLAAAHRRRPAEPIQPAARPATPRTDAPSADAGPAPLEDREPSSDLERVLVENRRMLESTIDTLLASNETLRRRNKDLRAENQRLLHAHAALDDVATLIAHDLKAPLQVIERQAGRLSTMLASGEAGQDGIRLIQPMQHRLAALGRVIDDLLAYAREGPDEKSDLAPVDFGDVMRQALALVGLPRGVRVVISPASLKFRTWQIPLACILRNLVHQAVDHIGDASGEIRIAAVPDAGFLAITISDDGREPRDRSRELGLAIVRQLLEAAGGRMTEGAEAGPSGHQVSFTWPITGEAIVGAAQEAPPPA